MAEAKTKRILYISRSFENQNNNPQAKIFIYSFRARQGKRVGGRRKALRRGRTNPPADAEAEAPPAPEGDEAVEGDEAADAGVEGEEAAEVPTWCDPTNEMGAWLNYASIRAICGERGFTDFGPYGGLPAEEAAEEGDEAVEGDIAEEVEEAIEEIVAEERRRRRQLRSRRFRNRKN